MGRSVALSVLDPIARRKASKRCSRWWVDGWLGWASRTARLDRALTATPEFRELGYFADLISEFDARDTPVPTIHQPRRTPSGGKLGAGLVAVVEPVTGAANSKADLGSHSCP